MVVESSKDDRQARNRVARNCNRRYLPHPPGEGTLAFRLGCAGRNGSDSDFDLLDDFLPGARPGLLGVAAMTRELSTLLGRRVDLAAKPALKPLIRSSVLADARLIYAA